MWFRKEPDYLWVDVMSEGKIHNVVNKMISHLRLENPIDIRRELDCDEQEKMKTVNTEPEYQKALKEYKAEGRIIDNNKTLNEFLYKSLKISSKHKDVLMNPIFVDQL